MGRVLRALSNWIFGPDEVESEHRPMHMSWDYDPETNKLYLCDESYQPTAFWSLFWLEGRLQRMLNLIEESRHPITVEAVMIEIQVAFGLWQEGTLTLEHMERAKVADQWIEVKLPMLGAEMSVRIYEHLYWEAYSFLVSGHPKGDEVMRDTPDFLGIISGEPAGVRI